MAANDKIEPLVSVIVPCYNQGIYLAEALDSVLAQTYLTWECIIIDDGSTDNTGTVATAFTQKDKRFKYIHQLNKGLPASRNAAIKSSSGKYILPLDADDKISSRYVAEAVNILEKSQDVKLVYCRVELFGKKTGEWYIPEYSYKQLLIRNLIFCSAVYRREDFEKTHGYNETFPSFFAAFSDWEFWLTLLSENDKVFQLSGVHFYYRIKETSMISEFDEEKQKKSRLLIYNEHKNLYDKYFTIPGLIFDNYQLDTTRRGILRSKEYLIGRFVLSPVRFLMKLFK